METASLQTVEGVDALGVVEELGGEVDAVGAEPAHNLAESFLHLQGGEIIVGARTAEESIEVYSAGILEVAQLDELCEAVLQGTLLPFGGVVDIIHLLAVEYR